MNNRRALIAHAARGPVMLITIGILFWMHQAGTVSFSRTWPLIIIVFGIMKLFERVAAPPLPYQAPPYPQPPYGQPPYPQAPFQPPSTGPKS